MRHGHRVVFDASGSHVEKKMTNDMLWLRERDGVACVVDVVVAPAREQKSKPSFGRRGTWRGLQVQMTQQRNMECGTEESLRAMDVDEKMDEDKRKGARREEDEDEEQEEEHQKARAIASLELPNRREVEDHNLTHVPFRSWCNHCMGGRGRRRALNKGARWE